MQKALFITMLLLMFVWGGVAFGADTCPDVTGLWEGAYNAVFYHNQDLPEFSNGTNVMAVHAQNGCSFYGSFENEFIIVTGTLRKLSSSQYVVTMQIVSELLLSPFGSYVIEGTLNCSSSSGIRNAFPSPTQPVCNTMSTSFHAYFFRPNNPSAYVNSVGTINFSKQ